MLPAPKKKKSGKKLSFLKKVKVYLFKYKNPMIFK